MTKYQPIIYTTLLESDRLLPIVRDNYSLTGTRNTYPHNDTAQ